MINAQPVGASAHRAHASAVPAFIAMAPGSPVMESNAANAHAACSAASSDIGIWLAARRLHHGKFVWPAPPWPLEPAQLDALVLGLPWQRMGSAGIITVV